MNDSNLEVGSFGPVIGPAVCMYVPTYQEGNGMYDARYYYVPSHFHLWIKIWFCLMVWMGWDGMEWGICSSDAGPQIWSL